VPRRSRMARASSNDAVASASSPTGRWARPSAANASPS
jgi:hypothetical protein